MDSPGPGKKGGGERSFLMLYTAGVKKVFEVNRLDDFKKMFNVWISDFRCVVSKSMMCLRDKVGHSGEEVSDLG